MFSKAETSLEPGEHHSPAIDPQATAEIIEAALKKRRRKRRKRKRRKRCRAQWSWSTPCPTVVRPSCPATDYGCTVRRTQNLTLWHGASSPARDCQLVCRDDHGAAVTMTLIYGSRQMLLK